MAGSPMSETKRDYEVDRGKPPVHSRCKNGQSGNPRGPRPKSVMAPLRQRNSGGNDRSQTSLIEINSDEGQDQSRSR
jgi:hypothetical protein